LAFRLRTAQEPYPVIDTLAPNGALRIFGVTLIGATPENGRKLLLTFGFIVAVLALGWLLRQGTRALSRLSENRRISFWGRQVVNLAIAGLLLIGVLSVWFDDPNRLATAAGLVTAGLAFALQRVITATAGYFVILRGKTFNVGDRIVMGGVRGDVVALSFMQTTILEMGQPPPVQAAEPPMWVHSRQYTGRIVTVSNAKVFDEPVYNYSRRFPYIWEELRVPIRYADDRAAAERILLEAAERHTADIVALGKDDAAELQRRYDLPSANVEPRVYWRLTDNWLELTVRFLAGERGTRELKDAITREVLARFDEAGIGIASATYEIVGVPPVQVQNGAGEGSPRAPRAPR
jgi:small-conductance mechanosensitive channel